MKTKISVSVEEETLMKIREKMRSGLFRSKSHFVDYAINSFLKNEVDNV